MNMYLKDPKTNQPSVTLTLFVLGYLVCLSKLITSGLITKYISFGLFSGSDFAMAVGSLGAVYVVKKRRDIDEADKK